MQWQLFIMFLFSKLMMKKIEQQDLLINEMATRGTHEERHDVLKPDNGKNAFQGKIYLRQKTYNTCHLSSLIMRCM